MNMFVLTKFFKEKIYSDLKRPICNQNSRTVTDNSNLIPCMSECLDCLGALRHPQPVRISYAMVFVAWPTLFRLSNEM